MKTVFRTLTLLAMLAAAPAVLAQSNWLDITGKALKGLSATSMSEEDEIEIGNEVAARVMGVYPLVKDNALQRKLNRVGLWVALQSTRPALPWRFALLESDTVNAIAAPGGIVLITTGMYALIKDEAELACVFGHEVGHIARKHHLTALRNGLLKEAAIDAAAAAANQRGGGSPISDLIKEKGREMAIEMVSLSLGRGEETEADQDGVLYAARAGYAAEACLTFMQRLETNTAQTSAFEDLLKTHPSASDRKKDVEAALARLKGAGPAEGLKPLLQMRNGKKG